MEKRTLTLGHSPDPDDAFMFYALAKELIPTGGFRFEHRLQRKLSREEIIGRKIAVPGTMTSAFLALQLWAGQPAKELDYVVVPFDQIFAAVRSGAAEVGLIIHEGQLTYQNEGLMVSEDLGVWWGRENGGLPLPLGGTVIHKRFEPGVRKTISDILTASIRFSLEHRPEAVGYALQFARDMGRDLADRFVGMYVNHWTLDYGNRGRESIRRFLGQAAERGLIPRRPDLEFVQ
jgi:1,4-dihydroxy-6-naphthoate synthase